MTEIVWSKLRPAEKFLRAWEQHGYSGSDLVQEYRFAPGRKLAFDFAWPSCKVAVEIQGFGYGHQAQQHQAADMAKHRLAMALGWQVVFYTSRCIGSRERAAEAVEYVCERLTERYGRIHFAASFHPQAL